MKNVVKKDTEEKDLSPFIYGLFNDAASS